ncbi:hypothetical protein J7L01_05875 [bacterium]|nr:hypothetical protein [bacterium]
MKRLNGIIIFPAILAMAVLSQSARCETISLPDGIEPVAIAADGFGRFFVLDESGAISAIDTNGAVVASLEPAVSTAGIVDITDIAFSAGWLYLADYGGGALFVTDRTLREPTRISLDLDGESIRPEKIAVATNGQILIVDPDRSGPTLFQSWKDPSPRTLSLPANGGDAIRAIDFDRTTKGFFLLTEDRAYAFSLFGALESRYIAPDSSFLPIAAFVVGDRLAIIGKKDVALLVDGDFEILPLEYDILAASQDIVGRIVMVSEKYIIVRERFE